jgi:hypothetical protein
MSSAPVGEQQRERPEPDQRQQRPEPEQRAAAKEQPRTAADIPLSSSVRYVIDRLVESVPAGAVVNGLLQLHPEYGAGAGRSFQVNTDKPSLQRRLATEWVQSVLELYDPTKLRELQGRVMILGLALLERDVAVQLYRNGFFSALDNELTPDVRLDGGSFSVEGQRLGQLLSERGREVRDGLDRADSVRSYVDRPVVDEDDFSRAPLAEALARRIAAALEETTHDGPAGAFVMHIDGPWGSGKSSLMGQLSKQMCERGWLTVDFNAWQHQRLKTPWWWLMRAIYRRARSEADWRQRLRLWISGGELLNWGWAPRVAAAMLAVFAVSVLLWVGGSLNLQLPLLERLEQLDRDAKVVGGAIGLISGIWGTALLVARNLLAGTVRGGEQFLNETKDPQQALRDYFKKLENTIKRQVVVFVDDLDRCRSDYVVEFLEGIQTLFSDRSVAYVIAADGRWLRTAYVQGYKDFADTVRETGRPMGYLFLEKLIQLSVPMPRMLPTQQQAYWRKLLSQSDGARPATSVSQATAAAAAQMADLPEDEVINLLQRRLGEDPVENEGWRRAAVDRLSHVDIQKRREHTLLPLARLLEQNPRAMKRLVNAYGVQRDINTLDSDLILDPLRLGRWTLITLRWPVLEDYLTRYPKHVAFIGSKDEKPGELLAEPIILRLFDDETVIKAFHGGNGLGDPLDEAAVRVCLRLPSEA